VAIDVVDLQFVTILKSKFSIFNYFQLSTFFGKVSVKIGQLTMKSPDGKMRGTAFQSGE